MVVGARRSHASGMSTQKTVSRRAALGAVASSVVALGCGGSQESSSTTPVGSGGGPAGGTSGGGSGGTSSTGGSAGTGTGGGLAQCKAFGPTPGCAVTDDNILGPFYKADAPFRSDITEGSTGTALRIQGTVYGCDCQTPLAGAVVDIWQADDSGAYDNTGFVLRGRVKTDDQGRYELTTILPGLYLNGSTYRPRHVHYKVSHADGVALTTQLYFEGDPWIASDAFVKASLVRPLVASIGATGKKEYDVTFDVVLTGV